MSSMTGVVMLHHPPPHVVPSSRITPNKTSTTAITSTNSTSSIQVSKMAARDRAQSWRGKYLRALNICPEVIEMARRKADTMAPTDKDKARVRTLSYSRGDFPERNSISRSYSSSTEREDDDRKSLERLAQQQDHGHDDHSTQQYIHAVPLRVPSRAMPVNAPTANACNPYGFAIRPDLARGRRCHTDPFVVREHVSAPIQIPTVRSGVSAQLDGNDRMATANTPMIGQRTSYANENHARGLPLWEEPASSFRVVANGWHIPHGARREQPPTLGAFNEHVLHDDEEDIEDEEDRGDDIFEMEGLDDSSDNENQSSNDQAPGSAKSRRRFRTASLNSIGSSGREKRVHRPAFEDAEDASRSHVMSQSFVPPHQLVQRDCFSIGMRDEFKRRPANNI